MAFLLQSARGIGIGIGIALVLAFLYFGLPRVLDWYQSMEHRRGQVGAGLRLFLILLVTCLALLVILSAWFTYNRAIDGENAWLCLQRPQLGCGIASPPSGPPPPAKK